MKTILVPVDFSENSINALNYAIHLAEKIKVEVILLHVLPEPSADRQMAEEILTVVAKDEERICHRKLKDLVKKVETSKRYKCPKCRCMVSRGDVVKEISLTSTEQNADLIVMGTTGASRLKELTVGSNTAKVIEKSKIPLLAIPEKAKFGAIRKIIYAADFKKGDLSMIQRLVEWAELFDAHISVLHISTTGELDADEKLDELLREARSKVYYKKILFHILNKGRVVEGIDEFVKHSKANMLAMATYDDRGLFDSLFHKSLTKKMVYHTHIPLLAFHKRLRK